ncbi:cobalt transport protein CbiM [compost metagenome]
MEVFHLPVGASELHFVGASAVYIIFGFIPSWFGFAIGLLLQGLLFEPQDLVHLGVNSLSLMLPLIAAHGLLGRRFVLAVGVVRTAVHLPGGADTQAQCRQRLCRTFHLC